MHICCLKIQIMLQCTSETASSHSILHSLDGPALQLMCIFPDSPVCDPPHTLMHTQWHILHASVFTVTVMIQLLNFNLGLKENIIL